MFYFAQYSPYLGIILSPIKDDNPFIQCDVKARDADKFVRIWMKGDDMLFTGNIRLTEDSRLTLTGKTYQTYLGLNTGFDSFIQLSCS